MYSHSTAFADGIRDGRPTIAYADLYKNGALLKADLPVIGRVSIDETAASRRSFQGQVILGDDDAVWAPRSAADNFTPFGSELQIRSGLILPGGVVTLLPICRCRLVDVETDGNIVDVSGPDRSIVVTEGRPEVPYIIANGTNLGMALRAIIESRIPGLDYAGFGVTDITLNGPIVLEEISDLWQEAQDLAAANGFELFFNQVGNPVFRAKLDTAGAGSVWNYAPGPDNIFLGGKRRFSSQGLKNVWVAKGDPNGVTGAVRASAEITDVTNPLFPGSGFGRRPGFFYSQYLSTTGQCQQVANGLKVSEAGFGDSLKFRVIPHPGHEEGDVVSVKDDILGVDQFVSLSSWDLDVRLQEEVEFVTKARRSA